MGFDSHIVVLLDGSAMAQAALPLALALARRHGQAVELVHVHPPSALSSGAPHADPRFDREQRDGMQRGLAALAESSAAGHAQAVQPILLDGPVGKTLEIYLARRPPGLVVLATHGRGGLSRAWLGSVADRLVRRARVPLLIVRPTPGQGATAADGGFRRVLVPLDGSKLAEQVLDPALALGAPPEAEYVLVTVVEPPELSDPSVMMAVSASTAGNIAEALTEIAALRQSAAKQYLGLVADQLRRRGVAARTHVVVHPQAAQGILDYAAESGADLIAVATHGLGGLSRFLLGSVADKVIRGASVPVLVVHPGDGTRAPA